MTLIYLEPAENCNPLVECPVCHFKGRLMEDFSLLAAGFNGIKSGSEDDVDLQECPQGHRLEY